MERTAFRGRTAKDFVVEIWRVERKIQKTFMPLEQKKQEKITLIPQRHPCRVLCVRSQDLYKCGMDLCWTVLL